MLVIKAVLSEEIESQSLAMFNNKKNMIEATSSS